MHGKSYSSSAKGISMQLHIFSIHNITERIRKKNMNKPHNPLTHHHISLFISFFFFRWRIWARFLNINNELHTWLKYLKCLFLSELFWLFSSFICEIYWVKTLLTCAGAGRNGRQSWNPAESGGSWVSVAGKWRRRRGPPTRPQIAYQSPLDRLAQQNESNPVKFDHKSICLFCFSLI